jgi:flagellar hook-associated protein 2
LAPEDFRASWDGRLKFHELFPIRSGFNAAFRLHEPVVEAAMSVGISFGSPTSGDGFDVSATVSEIVANLQNVETPWKNQLKTLDSQDTVISNLGSLLSTLSTDMTSLTEATGVMSEKEGSSSDESVLKLTAASSSTVAGTHTVKVEDLAVTSSGSLTEITDSSDKLSGSISIQVGSGTAQTISVPTKSGENTLSGLASAINSAGIGVTASVLTDSSGSRLSLVSGTSGKDGNLTVTSSITDTSNSNAAVSYDTSTAVAGANGKIVVDNVSLSVSSNTVSDLIPGVTFKLLSTSDTAVQVVIANYNTGVESSVSTLVSDYNALLSAINTQEGNDSSGNSEPLYGSPTLTMLQQDILGGINTTNPNGYLTSVDDSLDSTLSGSMTIKTANGFLLSDSVTAGSNANTSTGASAVTSSATLTGGSSADDTLSGSISIQVGSGTAQTFTLDSSDNTLSGLASAINGTTDIGVKATVTTTDGVSTLTLTSGTSGSDGSLTVTNNVRDTSAQTISVPTTSGDNTIDGLASAINAAGIGVTAAVTTSSGKSTLTLTSQTTGSSGALTVTSAVTATSNTALSATVTAGSDSVTSSAELSATAADKLSGSINIKVGSSGTAHTINVTSGTTLTELADTINQANIGVTAAAVTTNGTTSLTLTSGTSGSDGTLTVTSSILDTTNSTTADLGYTNSSDIGSLSALGVSVNTDGTLSLDETTLDSVLNSDYSSVAGFFQNTNSWGSTFSSMLTNAGTTSKTGLLKLAETSNSSTESSLNKDITREESLISSEESSLTTELNSANEVMQEIPSKISEINELYSAITGYNSSSS